jgi:broad specificity phosphatase PhoE
MPILEIRRHAERTDRANEQSALSVAGRAMAESLATRTPKFVLVLSSPLPRAKETAQLIARRLDGVGIIELPAITLAQRLRTPPEGASFGYCEGVVVTYAKGAPTKIEIVRL